MASWHSLTVCNLKLSSISSQVTLNNCSFADGGGCPRDAHFRIGLSKLDRYYLPSAVAKSLILKHWCFLASPLS